MTQLTTRSGAPLSRLTFGTMQFGGTADAAASRAMYDMARAAGVNHFDTAVGYTGGEAEKLLGPMIAPEAEEVYLATKVGYSGGSGTANLHAQFDRARRQLGANAVDLLYLHRFDPDTSLEETFTVMASLQAKGLIRHIGISNFSAWQAMKAQAVCATLGTRIDVIQPMYNLVKRQAEVEILPMAADQDMQVCAYSPLGGGLLTGKYATGGTGRLTEDERYAARYGPAWMHDSATALTALAAELRVDAATLAVAWVAANPAKVSPIISARSAAQLEPSLAAESFDISPALYARISALSPTPAPATDRLEEA